MRSRPLRSDRSAETSVLAEIREGFRFVRSETWLWGTMLCAAFVLLVYIGPWDVLLPYVIKNELDATARDLGFVYAASGVGAVLAAIVMGQRVLPRRAITFMYVGFTLEVAMMIVYGLARAVWPMLIAAFIAGVAIACANIVWLTLQQRRVPGHLLGRVTSLDWLVALSLTPISFAIVGPVADAIGVRETLVGAGVLGAAIAIAFLFLPGMRDLERRAPEARALQ
jgi:MFS family permease